VASILLVASRPAPGQLIHGRTLQPVRAGAIIQPLRYAGITHVDDRHVQVSAPASDRPRHGCSAVGLARETYYTLGLDFHNPFVAADFADASVGATADGFAWAWSGSRYHVLTTS
jgi:hypothetical protein